MDKRERENGEGDIYLNNKSINFPIVYIYTCYCAHINNKCIHIVTYSFLLTVAHPVM